MPADALSAFVVDLPPVRSGGVLALLVLLASCDDHGSPGDPHAQVDASVLGSGLRIRDVTDPAAPHHADYLVAGARADITGATVVAVDTFDETGNGKSQGTIYVQDLGSKEPYSGTSLFAPSFVPGNLRVGAGDVLDLSGQYQENGAIGSAAFAPGAVLAQLSRPTATFRFEQGGAIDPTDITLDDLSDWKTGQRWINMLVRVKDVTLQDDLNAAAIVKGRLSARLDTAGDPQAQKCQDPFPKPPTLTNELFDASTLNLPKGTKITELVGVVVFFCNIHIAPRSAADVKH